MSRLQHGAMYWESGSMRPGTTIRYGQFAVIVDTAAAHTEQLLRSQLSLVFDAPGLDRPAELTGRVDAYEFVKSVEAVKSQLDILTAEALYAVVNHAAGPSVCTPQGANDNCDRGNSDGASD